MSKKALGIDLGSTVSEVAIMENGKPVVIVNEEGSMTTPSVIGLKDGERKIGNPAKRQMIVNPKQTVNLIKRFMGATYAESSEAISHVQYDVVNKNGRPCVSIDGKEYTPEELSSMILGKMKKIAEDYAGEKITDAVITVPAFFSDVARNATKTAGELAGLNVLRIIAEPTAALLSSNIDMKKDGKYMVVDFGGSTEDNSVAEISDGIVEIKATNGDVYLGGTDIDKAISDWVIARFKEDNGIDLSCDAQAVSRIMDASEKAKIELSSSSATVISLPYITASNGMPLHLEMELTKAEFEKLIEGIVQKLVSCARKSLELADLKANDLNGILLVGGSCRIPLVQESLTKEFGVPLIKSANLDLAVAEGAAIQANTLVGGEGAGDILLLDVCPLPYGIETMGGVMTTIIEANTTIPFRKSQTFTTAEDNQSAVTINVLTGLRPLAADNKSVGLFNLEGIMPAKRGVPQIEVTFDIDASGILSVSAKDKATNREQRITIENKNVFTDEEVERIRKDAEEHDAEDKREKQRIEKVNKCESTIFQTEKALESSNENKVLGEEDVNFFNERIAELKEMKEKNEYSKLDSVCNEIQAKWYAISSRAYGSNNGSDAFANGGQIFNDIFTKGGFGKPETDSVDEQFVK